jgi:hypothetical protein
MRTANENRPVALDIAFRASQSVENAKDACRELRRALKYAQPSTLKLSAARLWAFMLRNSPNTLFITEATLKKFVDALADAMTNSEIDTVLRATLLGLLGSAVFEFAKKDRNHPYFRLWKKIKPKTSPDQVCLGSD